VKYHRKLLAIAWLFFLAAVVPVNARQINGTPGSPSATQSINGQVLPAPALPFSGEVNLNADQSKTRA
jgi:arylsulfatase